jgi:ankyrin repeat protein
LFNFFFQAVESRNKLTAEWLLKKGVSPLISNNLGQTALHVAKLMKNQEIIQLLTNYL